MIPLKDDQISALLTLVLLIPMMIYGGFIVAVFWGWFIVPIFKTPELGVLQAIGIMMFVSLFKSYHKDDIDPFIKTLYSAGEMTILFVMGFVVHLLLA